MTKNDENRKKSENFQIDKTHKCKTLGMNQYRFLIPNNLHYKKCVRKFEIGFFVKSMNNDKMNNKLRIVSMK